MPHWATYAVSSLAVPPCRPCGLICDCSRSSLHLPPRLPQGPPPRLANAAGPTRAVGRATRRCSLGEGVMDLLQFLPSPAHSHTSPSCQQKAVLNAEPVYRGRRGNCCSQNRAPEIPSDFQKQNSNTGLFIPIDEVWGSLPLLPASPCCASLRNRAQDAALPRRLRQGPLHGGCAHTENRGLRQPASPDSQKA